MILSRAHIQNFRAIRDVVVEFGAQTAILGGNGAGKSTVLRAIDKFYSPTNTIELDDFFGRDTSEPIEISLTFTNFSADELERFGDRVQDNQLTVTRVFEAGGGRTNGRYFGARLAHPPFADIRAASGALEKRRIFNDAREQYGFDLARRADEIEPQLDAWERAHPGDCELMPDDGQFFGFSNVGRGNLQKSTSFVFIPAVRDASADAVDARGAVVARLMELVVRSAVQRRQDVRSFQERISREYVELVNPERLPELGALSGILTNTLRDFYAEAAVALKWLAPAEFAVPLPSAEVLLDEDGFEGPVDRKGHGLQRAFIVTLLQHLAKASAADAELPPEEGLRADDTVEGIDAGPEPAETLDRELDDEATAAIAIEPEVIRANGSEPEAAAVHQAPAVPPFVLPGLILAIEEPELYQHPTKQRHFARVLTRLTDGSLPGVAAQTQVVFASHSSLFVVLNRFDEVRVARRHLRDPDEHKECRITSSSIQAVAARLEAARNVAAGTFTPASTRARLHVFGQELSEGFFADLVVLVEGISDIAALSAAAALEGIDFEAFGIAVLQTRGKSSMDKAATIFLELEIPVYTVWDCDAGPHGIKDVETNRAIQRLFGIAQPYDARTFVGPDFASFETELEPTLKAEIGVGIYDAQVDAVRDHFGLQNRDEVLKTPAAMATALLEASRLGARSQTLAAIVEAIMHKRNR
ncbi:ATP-binding cassette domain-containing protein [Mesorhizobium sp. B1-1-1]|uniref:ATP-dependent nuclease n=1 Tax=Mesorhizobium sp. B1-1-1 TaxID=2589983 RepID=UPI00112EACCC|nr:AAA family ATPase [Mesorhizobium sp. B1-1-1]TPN63528.1 ATP-binding cassette domain-containing protein [Mesorhizobium sp. B1-1-1]